MKNKQLDFFLGALSPTGFAGYYSQLVRDTGSHVVLLKASPGCGKSTLIKKVAQYLINTGKQVQLIHCAQDPGSLDAVVCNAQKFIMVDATSPHCMEPQYPIAFEQVMPLYYCVNANIMQKHRAKIIQLYNKNKFLNERVTRYLAAAGSLLSDTQRTAQTFTNMSKVYDLAKALCKKYILSKGNETKKTGQLQKDSSENEISRTFTTKQLLQNNDQEDIRLLSAVTCDGVTCFEQTVFSLAKNIVVLNDEFGCACKALLYILRQDAVEKGYKIITCYCPLNPYDKIEHIIIPSLSLAFVTKNAYHFTNTKRNKENKNLNVRTIHNTRFCNKDGMSMRKKRLQFNAKATKQLILQAQNLMQEAKNCHDELEKYYTDAADFKLLDKAYQKIENQLSLKDT